MTNARALTVATVVFLACGVAWFIHAVRGMLAPFLISAVFAYTLSPWVGALEARGIRRPVAVTALFTVFLLAFAGAIAIAVPRLVQEVSSFGTQLPEYVEGVKAASTQLSQDIERRYPIIKEQKVVETLADNARRAAEKIASGLPNFLVRVATVLSLLVLVPFITYFFMVGGKSTIGWLFEKVPARHTETVLSLVCEIDESLGSYIHGQFVESMFVAILSAVGLQIIGVDYAVMNGGIAGFANMIPYLGPVVGTLPAVLVGFVEFQSLGIVVKVLIVFGVVQFLDNNIIQPVVVSRGVNIHPLVVVFAVMAGAELGGVLGMFLAVPVACMVKILVQVFARRLKLA
jgi:predicted PurR-regulated permease PerM